MKVLYTGDADGIRELFMPHGAPAQVGEKAIHVFIRNMFGQESNDLNFEPVEVIVLDGWAFSRAEVSGTTASKVDGTSTEIDNKSLFVLRRVSEGTWKIARLMWKRYHIITVGKMSGGIIVLGKKRYVIPDLGR